MVKSNMICKQRGGGEGRVRGEGGGEDERRRREGEDPSQTKFPNGVRQTVA